MKRTPQFLKTAFAIVTLVFAAACNDSIEPKDEIVYVDNGKLFNSFEMTKEREVTMKDAQARAKAELDSLGLKVQAKARSLQELGLNSNETARQELNEMQQGYLLRQRQLEEQISSHVENVRMQVWDSLNSLIGDFGREKGYRFILGANANGSIMYADSTTADVTQELIEYCNGVYKKEGEK